MIIIDSNTNFLPCPCCGDTDIQWTEFNFPVGERIARKCRNCGMQTGWHRTDKEAIEQWNTRIR